MKCGPLKTPLNNRNTHRVTSKRSCSIYRIQYEQKLKQFESINSSRVNEQRLELDALAERFHIQKQEDWYTISAKQVRHASYALIAREESLYELLNKNYNEFIWYGWLFLRCPTGYWNERSHQMMYIEWLSERLNIRNLEEWYNITKLHFEENFGTALIQFYNGSPQLLLTTLYPNFDWQLWRFSTSPRRYWSDMNNQRAFIDNIAYKLGVKTQGDFYKLHTRTLVAEGAEPILKTHKATLCTVMSRVYPEFLWFPWLFPKLSTSYWEKLSNKRKYFDWLADELGVHTQDDWYFITLSDIEHKSSDLLQMYDGVLMKALKEVYPEFEWNVQHYQKYDYWSDLALQRKVFDRIAAELGVDSPDDWHRVETDELKKRGGRPILRLYPNRLEALRAIYPEIKWHAWQCSRVPRGFWKNTSNVMEYLQWFQEKMNIKEWSDWHRVAVIHFVKLNGATLLQMFNNSIPALLQTYFPEHNWIPNKFHSSSIKSKTQEQLMASLQTLLPNTEVQSNFKHSQLIYSATGRPMEVDVFIPSLSLGFEYQGKHHYFGNFLFGGDVAFLHKDEEKRKVCEKAGITLIEIPYWWDLDVDSLRATIHQHRPDIFGDPGPGRPIPLTDPDQSTREKKIKEFTPSIDTVITSEVQLNHKEHSLAKWATSTASSAFAGIKTFWDGERFHLKSGCVVAPPKHFTHNLPAHPLEGTLYVEL